MIPALLPFVAIGVSVNWHVPQGEGSGGRPKFRCRLHDLGQYRTIIHATSRPGAPLVGLSKSSGKDKNPRGRELRGPQN